MVSTLDEDYPLVTVRHGKSPQISVHDLPMENQPLLSMANRWIFDAVGLVGCSTVFLERLMHKHEQTHFIYLGVSENGETAKVAILNLEHDYNFQLFTIFSL